MKKISKTKIKAAINFMKKKHMEVDQKRKYTNEEYYVHPLEVYNIVKEYSDDESTHIAALLHDTVEDTKTSLEEIENLFGKDVSKLVENLTDISKPTDGNRATRKELDRLHLSKADPRAKTVKLADMISNGKSIMKHDKEFAAVYLKEMQALIEVLTDAHPDLYLKARKMIYNNLKILFP